MQNKEQIHRADKVNTGKRVYGELIKKPRLFERTDTDKQYAIIDAEGVEHLVITNSIELLEFDVIEKYS